MAEAGAHVPGQPAPANAPAAAGVRVGLFPAAIESAQRGPEQWRATLRRVAEAGVDHLCVGDHVSFFVGAGSDGLITASSLLAAQSELPVFVGLYLLPLRHPVPVARQLATIAELAPGRLTLGVGVGGEDPHEIEVCGVDVKTRGRRMDECLRVLRGLAEGTPVSFDGEFFSLEDALILPAPSPPIPLIVGGRSDAAVRRAATLGDGWLGIWVSPRRYAAVSDQIAGEAAESGRDPSRFDHALNVWCGFAATREAAREPLAAGMQAFYQMPFEPFERYSPYGTPADVAEFLAPYIEAGCSAFNVIPCACDDESAIAAVGELRTLLSSRARWKTSAPAPAGAATIFSKTSGTIEPPARANAAAPVGS
jgi:alkanesulfonate monooxygenase SsuD/methylene tetrahydromethanopterin reductase-like flavin-dependent oxidoreductase (luciferase family)